MSAPARPRRKGGVKSWLQMPRSGWGRPCLLHLPCPSQSATPRGNRTARHKLPSGSEHRFQLGAGSRPTTAAGTPPIPTPFHTRMQETRRRAAPATKLRHRQRAAAASSAWLPSGRAMLLCTLVMTSDRRGAGTDACTPRGLRAVKKTRISKKRPIRHCFAASGHNRSPGGPH